MVPYIIKSFRGGISDESDKGIAGSFKHGYGINIHGRDDILTGKQAMATIEETLANDLIRFFVPASDGTTYCFGSAGSIYARSGDGAWNFAYNDENGEIKGAAEWEHSDGNNYLYWATATSVARRLLGTDTAVPWPAGTASQNYKTTLNSTTWHTMAQGAGQLNIANGNSLASIDFDGNFLLSDLNIRPGNLIKVVDERDDYIILGSIREDQDEQGHIWSWDSVATKWIQKKKIPIKGVNAHISTELSLLQGGDDGELFLADFVNPTPLHGVPGGGQVNPGGVSIEDDIAVFGFYGGTYPGIWSYGRKRKNRSFALNYDYRLAKTVSGSTVSEIGALAMVNGELLASWKTTDGSTSDYGVDSVSSTTKATFLYEGLEFDGSNPHLKKSFDTVKVITSPLISGTSYSVKYKKDRATTGGDSSANAGFKYAELAGNTNTSFSEASTTEGIFKIGDKAQIMEIGIEGNPTSNNSPEILAVVTYLEPGTEEYA